MAKTIKSISSLVKPERSMAIFAALAPITADVSSDPFGIHLRSLIPVRSCIHSSLVSIIFDKSSLVTTLSGTYFPNPIIFELYMCYYSVYFKQNTK